MDFYEHVARKTKTELAAEVEVAELGKDFCAAVRFGFSQTVTNTTISILPALF